jgi:hypothetical protein
MNVVRRGLFVDSTRVTDCVTCRDSFAFSVIPLAQAVLTQVLTTLPKHNPQGILSSFHVIDFGYTGFSTPFVYF